MFSDVCTSIVQTRFRRAVSALVATGVLASLPYSQIRAESTVEPIAARLAPADVDKGKRLFIQCSVCHVSTPGATTTIGPNLWNIVERRVAAASDFDYSISLKQVGGHWDFERLNVYLLDPKRVAPEGRMPFPGIKSIDERADLIAYLASLSDQPVALPVAAKGEARRITEETEGLDEVGDESERWHGLPAGPGREEVFYRCKVCHSLMIVKQQGLSRAAWDESLEWMVEEQGMSPIEDETARNSILDYLSTHFGLK